MKTVWFMPMLMLTAACAAAPPALLPPDAGIRPVVRTDNLDGRWVIVAIDDKPFTAMQVQLAGPSFQAELACNRAGATIKRNGDKAVFEQLMQTERGCDAERMAIDARVMAILRLPTTMELTPPTRLRLTNENGTIDLVRQGG